MRPLGRGKETHQQTGVEQVVGPGLFAKRWLPEFWQVKVVAPRRLLDDPSGGQP